MFCVYYVIWTESLGVSGRAGANHNAQWHPEFPFFFSECCLCISANLILYFMYVNQKLSCKMGSNKVFLNLNLKIGSPGYNWQLSWSFRFVTDDANCLSNNTRHSIHLNVSS